MAPPVPNLYHGVVGLDHIRVPAGPWLTAASPGAGGAVLGSEQVPVTLQLVETTSAEPPVVVSCW